MPKAHCVGFIILLLSAAGTVFAFNGHIVTEGPLELKIGDVAGNLVKLYTRRKEFAYHVLLLEG